MSSGTGTITIEFDADTKQAKIEIADLKTEAEEAGEAAADTGDGAFDKIGDAATTVAKTVTKTLVAAITGVGTAIASVYKTAVEDYAEYEQLVGGAETIFGDDAETVLEYASQAYETAGLSANDYLEQVTSFSASLVSSLEGDTAAAVEYANLAIEDMSDNANTFGTDIEDIQNAYQGFAKQNYTMLDNLKLGYAGTTEGMEELIADANELLEAQGEVGDLTIDSYADIIEAIHLVQEEMGVTGTTAEEAADTVEGSINSLSAAWENWLTGLGDADADVAELTEILIDSLGTVVTNLIPVIGQIGEGLSEALSDAITGAIDVLEPIIEEGIADLWNSFAAALNTFGAELPEISAEDVSAAFDAIGEAVQALWDYISPFVEWVVSTVVPVITEIIEALLPALQAAIQLIATVLEAVWAVAEPIITALLEAFSTAFSTIATAVTAAMETVSTIIGAVMDTVYALISGDLDSISEIWSTAWDSICTILSTAWDSIWETISTVLTSISEFMSSAWETISSAASTAWEGIKETLSSAMDAIGEAVSSGIDTVIDFFANLPQNILDALGDLSSLLWSVGEDIVSGLINGIKSLASSAVSAVTDIADSIVTGVKNFLGISSPSKVFEELGEYTMAGLEEGLEAGADSAIGVAEDVAEALTADLGSLSFDVGATISTSSLDASLVATSAAASQTTYIEQSFETKVVRSDSDLYTAAPILYRSAMREAALA